MQVEVAVLFVNTITKVIALTELSHLVSANLLSAKLFGNLMVGQILENAIVSYMDKKGGVHFKLPDEVKGFARVGSSCSPVAVLSANKPNRILYYIMCDLF